MKTEEDLFTMRYTSFKRIMPIPAHIVFFFKSHSILKSEKLSGFDTQTSLIQVSILELSTNVLDSAVLRFADTLKIHPITKPARSLDKLDYLLGYFYVLQTYFYSQDCRNRGYKVHIQILPGIEAQILQKTFYQYHFMHLQIFRPSVGNESYSVQQID